MGVLKVSRKEIKRTNLLDPGIFMGLISDVREEMIKPDPSDRRAGGPYMRTYVDFEIVDGSEQDNGTPVGVMVQPNFLKFGIKIEEALRGEPLNDEGDTIDLDKNRLKGEKMQLLIKNEEYRGSLQNRIEDIYSKDADV